MPAPFAPLAAVPQTAGPGVALMIPAWHDVLWTLVVLGVPLLLVVVLAVRSLRGGPTPPSRAAAAARRHAAWVHALAWSAGLGALLALGQGAAPAVAVLAEAYGERAGGSPALGRGVLVGLVPAGVGLAFLAVHAVGELTWPRPTGAVRRAVLTRRTTADVAPRLLRRSTWAWATGLVVVLVACGAVSPDGRSVARAWEGGGGAAGPFPGWFYGVPLLVAALVVLLAAEGVLRLVARRPAVTDAAPAWDLALRRLSAHRVLRGAQLVLGVTSGAVLAVAGSAVRNLGDPMGGPHHSAGLVALGAAVALLGVAVGLAAVLLSGVAGRPAGELDVVAPGVTPGVAAGRRR